MRTLITLFFLSTFLTGFSQNEEIIGTWYSTSGSFNHTRKFDSNSCLTDNYYKENGARVTDFYVNYEINNDSLITYWTGVNKNKETVNKREGYKILILKDTLLKLENKNGTIYEYNKIDSKVPITNTKLPNIFFNDSFGLGCISDTITDPEKGYENCLCFGEINFNTKLSEYIEKFGQPSQVMDNEDGSKYYIFILSQSEKTFSYLAVQLLNDKTKAIQLTGNDSSVPLSFSTIKLGDYFTYVYSKLGENYVQEEVEEISGYIWDYAPFPFSIEFDSKMRVYSIRISKK